MVRGINEILLHFFLPCSFNEKAFPDIAPERILIARCLFAEDGWRPAGAQSAPYSNFKNFPTRR